MESYSRQEEKSKPIKKSGSRNSLYTILYQEAQKLTRERKSSSGNSGKQFSSSSSVTASEEAENEDTCSHQSLPSYTAASNQSLVQSKDSIPPPSLAPKPELVSEVQEPCNVEPLDHQSHSICLRERQNDAHKELEKLLSLHSNKFCADCGSPNPKWGYIFVSNPKLTEDRYMRQLIDESEKGSLNFGVLICIKCSGIHRSLGVHITKVISVELDEWTDEQVEAMIELGGNAAANRKYEAFMPGNSEKPKPDSSTEERDDFIRRKYVLLEFSSPDGQLCCPLQLPHRSSSSCPNKYSNNNQSQDKRRCEKESTRSRIRWSLHHSWGRKQTGCHKRSNSSAGMVEFVGLIKVLVVRGTNLAIRDVSSSDPYVILEMGCQSARTRVIKKNLNPVWNESLMLSIPDQIPPLKVLVWDKDTFSTDDFMGDAEVDIRPLVTAAQAYEKSTIFEPVNHDKQPGEDNTHVEDGVISLIDGRVKQDLVLKLQNVETGALEIVLECLPLTQ